MYVFIYIYVNIYIYTYICGYIYKDICLYILEHTREGPEMRYWGVMTGNGCGGKVMNMVAEGLWLDRQKPKCFGCGNVDRMARILESATLAVDKYIHG